METKREIESKAKGLIISNPDEALQLYRLLYDNYSEEFNDWDAFFTIKAMRVSKNIDLDWAQELALCFKNEKVGNLYGWLIFDKCVKNRNREELIANEKIIEELHKISPQKNCRTEDKIPCPTTISILSLTKIYSKPSFNAVKIDSFLSLLNVEFLSVVANQSKNNEDNEDEFASDFEKYSSLKTKSLYKSEKFQECKELCELALKTLDKFHYNNETWFKMRIALSEDKLGNHELSESLLQELLYSRAGNDKWFLYRDIAEVYYEQKEYEKAMKYAVDAAFYGNEAHYLIGLYLLQARLRFKLNNPHDAKNLAELIVAILKEQNWNEKQEYTKLIDYFGIDRNSVRTVKEIIKDLNPYWLKVRYSNKELLKGKIISIHPNGKKGRIKNNKGAIIDFNKKNLVQRIKSLDVLKGLSVQYYEMDSFEGTKIAEQIVIDEQEKTAINNTSTLLGKSFSGTISGITDFGIFVKFNNEKGLIHKNSLNATLKINYQEQFKNGQTIKVIVDKITDKGFSLKYCDD